MFPSGANFTKIYVKHFCPIWPDNLTRPKTMAAPSVCKIDQFLCPMTGGGAARRRGHVAGSLADVSFAGGMEFANQAPQWLRALGFAPLHFSGPKERSDENSLSNATWLS
jgi:hypothetical protein